MVYPDSSRAYITPMTPVEEKRDGSPPAPSELVRQYHKLVGKGRVLELGVSGRDGLFLASRGYRVTRLTASQDIFEENLRQARALDLELDLQTVDFVEYHFPKARYNMVTADFFFHLQKRALLAKFAEKIIYTLKKHGLLIGATFSREDILCAELIRKRFTELGSHCFVLPGGELRTFFGPREILELFAEMKILHYAETDYYEKQGEEGRWRSLVEFVLKKTD
ncbi:MAG: hypothetical protein GF404_00400 [candidate division Zixibacteria bacterium]|nr:hypothetical protein [candidate division Zixibacteria bacterium]